jgi:hypothetical protein
MFENLRVMFSYEIPEEEVSCSLANVARIIETD